MTVEQMVNKRLRDKHGHQLGVWYYPVEDESGPSMQQSYTDSVYAFGPCCEPSECFLMVPPEGWDCE